VIAAGVLAGCKSTSPSQYISPRVEGRVLDTQTHQPLEGVKVRRVIPDQSQTVAEVRKGGQIMEQTPAIRSRNDGTFALDSERGLEFLRRSSWISVTITFEQTGYESFTTNYSLVHATNTPSGEPLVKAGDILLVPRSK
jgi:hypothetical protein